MQKGGYLYKPTSSIKEYLSTCKHLKASEIASQKADQSTCDRGAVVICTSLFMRQLTEHENCTMLLLVYFTVHTHTGDTGLRGPVGEAGIPGAKGIKGDQGT